MSYDARPEFDLQELVNEYGLGGVSSLRKAESCGPDDQPTILVAEFQDLLSQEESEHAWLHSVTESHLDELYATINRAGGTSYRPNVFPSPLSIPSVPTIGMSTKASPYIFHAKCVSTGRT
jgi:hypothetical protein